MELVPLVGQSFLADDLDRLADYLDAWHATGLWQADRFAMHLQIPARSPSQALEWALEYYQGAATAAGAPGGSMVRIEILTVEDMEGSWAADDANAHEAVGRVHDHLVSDDAYAATRRLLSATTAAELFDTVVQFVTAVGGQIAPGAAGHLPGQVDVDLNIDGFEACQATADGFSVAGLMLEHFLPTLLADARVAFARMHSHRR